MDIRGYSEYVDIEDYFDEDAIKMLDDIYVVGES